MSIIKLAPVRVNETSVVDFLMMNVTVNILYSSIYSCIQMVIVALESCCASEHSLQCIYYLKTRHLSDKLL